MTGDACVTLRLRSRQALSLLEDDVRRGRRLSLRELEEGYGPKPEDVRALRELAWAWKLECVPLAAASRLFQLRGSFLQLSEALAALHASARGEAVLDVLDGEEVRSKAGRAAPFDGAAAARRYRFPEADGTGSKVTVLAFHGDAPGARGGASVRRLLPGRAEEDGVDEAATAQLRLLAAAAPGAKLEAVVAPDTEEGWAVAFAAAVFDEEETPAAVVCGSAVAEARASPRLREAVDATLLAAAALGVLVCCASGDDGAQGDDVAAPDGLNEFQTCWPASSPHALACGGTQLDGLGNEVVWNDGGRGRAGGGVSVLYGRPWYQTAYEERRRARLPRSLGSRERGRGVPDVAFLAARAGSLGSTAASAALAAALAARLCHALGKRPEAWHAALYEESDAVCREVLWGTNAKAGRAGYEAGPGWNGCAGLGTVDGSCLLEALLLRSRGRSDALETTRSFLKKDEVPKPTPRLLWRWSDGPRGRAAP